jgi:hypothetical protein
MFPGWLIYYDSANNESHEMTPFKGVLGVHEQGDGKAEH